MPNQLDVEGAVEKGEKKLNEEAARKTEKRRLSYRSRISELTGGRDAK
jgi:hypothetical protein